MQTIKKLDPKSCANVYGFFLALAGFLTSLGISAINIINIFLSGDYTFGSITITILFNILLGILVGLITAVLGMLVGWIAGYIFAWFYNVAVRIKFIGGIKIKLD